MPGLLINGREVSVPGRQVVNFRDDPRIALKLPEDGRRRDATAPVTLIVLHTTKGIPGGKDKRPQLIKAGLGPDVGAELRTARWWSSSDLQSGAHLVVDADGSIGCLADLQLSTTYHARLMNTRSIGIEIYQGADAELYLGQLEAVADLVDVLTAEFGIQRQIPDRYRGPLARLASGGADFFGVVGHRDGDDNRGEGDPGNAVFDVLAARGYERFDLKAGADIAAWKKRQESVSLELLGKMPALKADGVPGFRTTTALKKLGYAHGLWACPPAS
jgi:hypothetical protein